MIQLEKPKNEIEILNYAKIPRTPRVFFKI